MFKNILFLISLVGCVKQVPTSGTGLAGLYKFAGENFSSTNSPCLDGVIVAVDHSCAVPMQLEEGDPYIMIQCTKVRDGAARWDQYNVIAIINPLLEDPQEASLMCMDPYTRVYIQTRP